MPAIPDFNRAGYGPLALRDLLRARREPNERLVAWGVAEIKPARDPGQLLGLLGPLGWIAGSMTAPAARRVVILTDQRLLLLRTGPLGPTPQGLGVIADAPLGSLLIATEDDHFELLSAELGKRVKLAVKEPRSRDGARLIEALAALATDSPS